jgi:hypothetical protein
MRPRRARRLVGGGGSAEAQARLPAGTESAQRLSVAALVFLRGRDADGRLRELCASAAAARPVLGALAVELVERRLHEALGFRSLGDYGRERLGVGARTLREWARVSRALTGLPLIREAVVTGEVSWTVARRVVGLVTPETQAACVETVRGRTVRAVEAIVAAVRAAEGREAEAPSEEVGAPEASVPVRIPCTAREAERWHAAVELARRMAGESIPVWACAEAIAAEAVSAWGAPAELSIEAASERAEDRCKSGEPEEHGLRHRVFPGLGWHRRRSAAPHPEISVLAHGASDCPELEIDRRLRAAIAFLQDVDLEIGRVLGQVQRRGLFRELGFESFERYVVERLDLAPRTARRLVAIARSEGRAPALASAFREGRVHAFQAAALLPVVKEATARAWVERARAVSLRRLEDDVAAEAKPAAIAFRAPPEVAALFLSMLASAGSLEALFAHAIAAWTEAGSRFRDSADFERDGWRCTVPGCTARRNLQSHHIRFRSAGGPDEPWNRTTLCAFHHHRGVHAGTVPITGRAPDALVFELAGERWRSGDVRAS